MLKNFDIKPPFFEVGPKAIIWGDAMLALAALGFSDDKARKMVSDVLEADPQVLDTETVIKRALGGGK